MQSVRNQVSRVRIKIIGLLLGSMLLASVITAEGARNYWLNLSIFQQPQIRYVLTVCPAGPPACQFKRIQDAVDVAPEDLSSPRPKPAITKIQVGPGTYEENLIIRKSVILEGTGRDRVFLSPSTKPGLDNQVRQESTVGVLVVTNIFGVFAEISGFHIQRTDRGNQVSVMVVGSLAGSRLFQNTFDGAVWLDGSLRNFIEENEFHAEICQQSFITNVGFFQTLKIQHNSFRNCTIDISGARLNIIGGLELNKPGDRLLIEDNQGLLQINISDSAAVMVRNNTVGRISLKKTETVIVEANTIRKGAGIQIEASRDVVIQKNILEENLLNGITVWLGNSPQRPSVSILNNRVLRNSAFGIVTESVDYITTCKDNEVKDNKNGDYGVGPSPQTSPELKQKCEGN